MLENTQDKNIKQNNGSEPDGEIMVAVFNKTIYIKPFGFATQQNALGLPDFLKVMLQKGNQKVAFDLLECVEMDSTFLGGIASAALTPTLRKKKNVVILNASEHAKRQIQLIGLQDLTALKEEACTPPPDLQLSRIDFFHLPSSEKERLERIKELHEQLAGLNARNRQNFGAFVKMLDEELQQKKEE